jgi:DUF971 family protein
MSKINCLVINNATASLSVSFGKTELEDIEQQNSEVINLKFEYLRVFAPTTDKDQAAGSAPKVYHKKLVRLLKIESVGKHGYRFIFDDEHSGIYNSDYLKTLGAEYQQRWQNYLKSTGSTVNSREASIEIKEVK